jgi:hypothetical protein
MAFYLGHAMIIYYDHITRFDIYDVIVTYSCTALRHKIYFEMLQKLCYLCGFLGTTKKSRDLGVHGRIDLVLSWMLKDYISRILVGLTLFKRGYS